MADKKTITNKKNNKEEPGLIPLWDKSSATEIFPSEKVEQELATEIAEEMVEAREEVEESEGGLKEVDPAAAPSTKKARAVGGENGRIQKKIYAACKERALQHEPENYSKLYIVHEKKGWWKMFGHSAIMFHYSVAKWANINSRLKADSDFGIRSEEGVINIKDIYELDRKLTKAGVSLLYSSDDIRIYNIGKKYTEADINAMIKTEELAWARANQTIKPKEVFPSLYSFLLRLLNEIYFLTAKMDKTARHTFGEPMTKIVTELVRDYVVLCNEGGLSDEEFLQRISRELQEIKGYTACLMETRVVKLERAQTVLYSVEKVKRTIEQCRPKKV